MSRPPRVTQGCEALLQLLRAPERAGSLALNDWDRVIRLARQARLLGTLHQRLADHAALDRVPPQPRGHLQAAAMVARQRAQLMRMELASLADALRGLPAPVVILKGAAYLQLDLPMARGRMPCDVDLMVVQEHLAAVEQALLAGGWESQVSDDYDQRYYREWSHELPPLRRPGHGVEVDLHHAITPSTGRLRPDAQALIADALAVPGSRWRTLSPFDQILHVAVHLFQDSDLAIQLHQLVDFDALIRHYAAERWTELSERAAMLGLEEPLHYAFRYSSMLLQTPGPEPRPRPSPALRQAAMDWLAPRALLPADPNRPPPLTVRLARAMLHVRYHWLRMPPRLLFPHLARKLVRRLAVRSGAPPKTRSK